MTHLPYENNTSSQSNYETRGEEKKKKFQFL